MDRIHDVYRPVAERVRDFREVERMFPRAELASQAQRCHDCGIPFCHGAGCPLGNVIPEFNSAVAKGDMLRAWEILSETSYFPEFTCRICPALCEGACTCGIDGEPVMVRQCEKLIVETAFAQDWVEPVVPAERNGVRVAVIGSGPAGLFSAEALNRAGFTVTVFEAMHRPGGLLRYGIPDFKLDKAVIDRRLKMMERAGISFACDTEVGRDISGEYLKRQFDFILIAIGTPAARDLKIPGRELEGIRFALEFLRGQNRVNAGELPETPISAKGKKVLVIGGGDTGSDCVGTAIRQGAASVTQIEIMPRPPESRSPSTPWPQWPYMLRTSSSHQEGCERRWDLSSVRFHGSEGAVHAVEVNRVRWEFSPSGRPLKFETVPDSTEMLEADLVLLAMGFCGTGNPALAEQLGLTVSGRGTLIPAPEKRIFVAGDCANGASLVVRAMADGGRAARQLMEEAAK